MKKTFLIEQNQIFATAKIEIDFSFELKYGEKTYSLDELIKEYVQFWSGWEKRLWENDGNYTITFLKDLLKEICLIYFGSNCNYNIIGIISEFENKEGYPSLDGKYGIKLLDFEKPEILDEGDYSVTEC